MNYKFILAIILITATANVTIGAGLGIPIEVDAKKSASSSGYSHGENDCEKYQNGNDNLYITGYNKEGESTGPAHHTDAFNEAYVEGWTDAGCSVSEFRNLDFSNDGNYQNTRIQTNTAIEDSEFNRQQQGNAVETVQSSNQRGECGQIVFGDCNIGQSNTQKSENTQANSAQND
jgi:hypothetical protein